MTDAFKQEESPNPLPPNTMSEHSTIRDGDNDTPNDNSTPQDQKIITFKNRDYLLYEGRIIDEDEADRIYTFYHELLSQKQGKALVKGASGESEMATNVNNENSHASGLSDGTMNTVNSNNDGS